MSLPTFCADTVTVTRAASKTERGSTIRDWSNATTHTIASCSFQPRSTQSDDARRYNTSATAVLFLPAGADIAKGDRVTFSGVSYDVVGTPLAWRSPSGALSHTLAELVVHDG